jgi:hypothetical protein
MRCLESFGLEIQNVTLAIGKTSVKTVDRIATRRSGSTGKEEDEDDETLTQVSKVRVSCTEVRGRGQPIKGLLVELSS